MSLSLHGDSAGTGAAALSGLRSVAVGRDGTVVLKH